MFWCIIMSSNSKNCLQEEEYSMSMDLMIFMAILMIFIVMDKIGGRETKV